MSQLTGPKKIDQKWLIKNTDALACDYYARGDFVSAIEKYSNLVKLLQNAKYTKTTKLADAYWNFALANISRANELTAINQNDANLHIEQAKLQLKQALLEYPASAKADLRACSDKLMELNTFLIARCNEEDYVDVEKFSDKEESVEIFTEIKPAIVHWKKKLLQRYLAEHPNAEQKLTEDSGSPSMQRMNI